MTKQLSPGINIVEMDYTQNVETVETGTVGAFVGNFQWGPINQPTKINTERELVQLFGKPTNDNYISFFTAANYLSYTSNLLLQRVGSNNCSNAASSQPGVFENVTLVHGGDRMFSATPVLNVSVPSTVDGIQAEGTVMLSGGAITKGAKVKEGKHLLSDVQILALSQTTNSVPFVDGDVLKFSTPDIKTIINNDGQPDFDFPVGTYVIEANGVKTFNITHGGSGYITKQPMVISDSSTNKTLVGNLYLAWDALINVENTGSVGVVGENYTPTTPLSQILKYNVDGTYTAGTSGYVIGDYFKFAASGTKTALKTTANGLFDCDFDPVVGKVTTVDLTGIITGFTIVQIGSGYAVNALSTTTGINNAAYAAGTTVYGVETTGVYLPLLSTVSPLTDITVTPEHNTKYVLGQYVVDTATIKVATFESTAGGLSHLMITSAGDGFVSTKTVTAGTAFTFKPLLSYVKGINITNFGSGYSITTGTIPEFSVTTQDGTPSVRVEIIYDLTNANVQILNEEDYHRKLDSGYFKSFGNFVAKYPGEKGNSLKVSMCDSNTWENEFAGFISTKTSPLGNENRVDCFTAFITGFGLDELGNLANKILKPMDSDLELGLVKSVDSISYYEFTVDVDITPILETINTGVNITSADGNTIWGTFAGIKANSDGDIDGKVFYIKLDNVNQTPTASDETQTGMGNHLIFTGFTDSVKLKSKKAAAHVLFTNKASADLVDQPFRYLWEYSRFFNERPGTSTYVEGKGGLNDEVHVIILDEDGVFGKTGTVLEKHEGLSKAFDGKVGNSGRSNYYKDVLNRSRYIWWTAHPDSVENVDILSFRLNSLDAPEIESGVSIDMENIGVKARVDKSGIMYFTPLAAPVSDSFVVYFTTTYSGDQYKKIVNYVEGQTSVNLFEGATSLTNKPVNITGDTVNFGESCSNATFKSMTNILESSLVGGADVIDSEITTRNYDIAYRNLVDKNKHQVDIILTGNQRKPVVKNAIANIAEERQDCVVYVSPPLHVGSSNAISNSIVRYVNDINTGFDKSSYAMCDSTWKYQYDKYNDLYRWVPMNGDTGGICARTDRYSDPWVSPGGFTRGTVKNVVKLAFNPNQDQRDELYKAGVNPYVTFTGQGVILYGDKTLNRRNTAFDRINVRRLFITLENMIEKAANKQLFEFNDQITRAQFKNIVEPFLRDVQGRRGVTEFKVICDETNNTPDIIDTNKFIADIYIKPNRSINFITLNFIAAKSGAVFTELSQ